MTALAAGRQFTKLGGGCDDAAGQKGNTIVYAGGIVMLDASGYAIKGQTVTAAIAVGVAKTNRDLDRYDATATGPLGVLADGVQTVRWDEGIFPMVNSGGGDAILSTTQPGVPIWVVDDQTVALTNGGGTRSPAGRLHSLGADGFVYVEMGKKIAKQIVESTSVISMAIPLTGLVVGGGTAAAITPQFSGRIVGVSYSTTLVGAGAGATFAVSVKIAGTTVTGGGATLTLANQTQGAELQGAAVTALNTFTAGQQITIVNAAGTVFTSGQVSVNLLIAP